MLGYGRSIGLGRFSGKVDGAIARICLDGSADYEGERVTRNVCGFTDARARLTVNFLGAPALRRQEFASYRQDWVFGASVQVGLPVGDYDPSRLVNIGANRCRPSSRSAYRRISSAGCSSSRSARRSTRTTTTFYGGRVREQEPITSLQGHAVYRFSSGAWLAVDATRYHGGQTSSGNTLNPRPAVERALRRHGIRADQPEAIREDPREHGRVDAHGHRLRHAQRGLAVRVGRALSRGSLFSAARTCARGRTC